MLPYHVLVASPAEASCPMWVLKPRKTFETCHVESEIAGDGWPLIMPMPTDTEPVLFVSPRMPQRSPRSPPPRRRMRSRPHRFKGRSFVIKEGDAAAASDFRSCLRPGSGTWFSVAGPAAYPCVRE